MPISTNALYQGRRFLTKEGKANKEALAWESKLQWPLKMPLKGPIRLSVRFYWPNKRRHDVDNIKALLDSLSGIVYEDDSQINDLRVQKFCDKKQPRVEIEVL
jgi:crossover junction endodeoxyribonuclease RusA